MPQGLSDCAQDVILDGDDLHITESSREDYSVAGNVSCDPQVSSEIVLGVAGLDPNDHADIVDQNNQHGKKKGIPSSKEIMKITLKGVKGTKKYVSKLFSLSSDYHSFHGLEDDTLAASEEFRTGDDKSVRSARKDEVTGQSFLRRQNGTRGFSHVKSNRNLDSPLFNGKSFTLDDASVVSDVTQDTALFSVNAGRINHTMFMAPVYEEIKEESECDDEPGYERRRYSDSDIESMSDRDLQTSSPCSPKTETSLTKEERLEIARERRRALSTGSYYLPRKEADQDIEYVGKNVEMWDLRNIGSSPQSHSDAECESTPILRTSRHSDFDAEEMTNNIKPPNGKSIKPPYVDTQAQSPQNGSYESRRRTYSDSDADQMIPKRCQDFGPFKHNDNLNAPYSMRPSVAATQDITVSCVGTQTESSTKDSNAKSKFDLKVPFRQGTPQPRIDPDSDNNQMKPRSRQNFERYEHNGIHQAPYSIRSLSLPAATRDITASRVGTQAESSRDDSNEQNQFPYHVREFPKRPPRLGTHCDSDDDLRKPQSLSNFQRRHPRRSVTLPPAPQKSIIEDICFVPPSHVTSLGMAAVASSSARNTADPSRSHRVSEASTDSEASNNRPRRPSLGNDQPHPWSPQSFESAFQSSEDESSDDHYQ